MIFAEAAALGDGNAKLFRDHGIVLLEVEPTMCVLFQTAGSEKEKEKEKTEKEKEKRKRKRKRERKRRKRNV